MNRPVHLWVITPKLKVVGFDNIGLEQKTWLFDQFYHACIIRFKIFQDPIIVDPAKRKKQT